jgi:hypothetical protein
MKYFLLAAKLVLSFGLLAVVISQIDAARAAKFLLQTTTVQGIVIATLALGAQGLLAAGRQIAILALLDQRITFLQSLRVWFAGVFITQVAVTFIAGDLIRGILLVSDGVPRRMAGRAIVLDRIVGLAVLLLLVDAVLPSIAGLTQARGLRYSLLLLGVAATSGILAIALAGLARRVVELLPWKNAHYRVVEIATDLAGVSRFLAASPGRALAIAVISLVMHLLNVVGVVAIALSLGVQAPLWIMAAVVVPVMLLSMLPISFAGWGVREAALVTGFGLLQIPAELALATSIGFGLSVVFASLPGLPGLMQKRVQWRALIRPSDLSRS